MKADKPPFVKPSTHARPVSYQEPPAFNGIKEFNDAYQALRLFLGFMHYAQWNNGMAFRRR